MTKLAKIRIFQPMKSYTPEKMSIKAWAEEDRPREKLLNAGRSTLTDAELIAILLGTGSVDETAVDLAKRILASVDNNLHKLGEQSIKQLMQFKGIGEAKAVTIAACLELGRRRLAQELPEKPQITGSQEAFKILFPLVENQQVEKFFVLFLNRAHRVIDKFCISTGGISSTVVDQRVIFNRGIEVMATAMILCHNHPSGNLNPSDADNKMTTKIHEASKIMNIALLDHIIIAGNSYYSYADQGFFR